MVDANDAVLVGVLALAVGLPLLVTGMALEITGFLVWIGLQRRCGRGVHLPGVQLLVPVRDKYGVLGMQIVAGLMLVMASLHMLPAQYAGSAMFLAHTASGVVQCAARWRAHRFVQQQSSIE